MGKRFLENTNLLPVDYYKNITYYEISFGQSRSKYFNKAVEISKKYDNAKYIDNTIVVTIGNDNFEDLENLINCIDGWNTSTIKIDGNVVPARRYWDLCGRGCFRHAPKKVEYLKCYCTFGVELIDEIYDIKFNNFFGCTRLWMHFWLSNTIKIYNDKEYVNVKFEKQSDHCFTMVAFEKKGCDVLNERLKSNYYNNRFPDWIKGKFSNDGYLYIDKKNIKDFINSKLFYVKSCPVFDIDKCFERIDIFPDKLKYENGTESETMSSYLKLLFKINCIDLNEINDSLLKKWREFSCMDDLLL